MYEFIDIISNKTGTAIENKSRKSNRNTHHNAYTSSLGLHRALWNGLLSKSISGLVALQAFPKSPTATALVEQFSTPHDQGITYGQRLYGFFLPPETGNYIFAASCTDECMLSLSKTDEETKKDTIITHNAGR